MHKRRFLKLMAAILGGTSTSRLWGTAPSEIASNAKLSNWAGNFQYSTDQLHHAESVSHVRQFVREHPAFKALGTRHCFNHIADSVHALLGMTRMNQVLELDREARKVTVQAGMSYGKLCPFLDEQGFALHNLASLPHISIGGACATGTHGSGVTNGNLATAVSAIEFVTADGEVRRLSRQSDGQTFLGAVVHLGALGVVTAVTLDIEPSYKMRQYVYERLPMSQLLANFDAIVSSGYSVSLFTDWRDKRVNEVWIKERVHDTAEDNAASAELEFHGSKLATKNLHPIAELSAENCTPQLGVVGPWYERLPHFRMGFTPSSGKELQSEYFVSRENAVEAIQAVERLRDQIVPHLMISELRTVDADQLWMSPCYGRPSLAIHFTWKQDWPAVSQVLPMIEKELARFQVRPHWGKLFSIAPRQLRTRYEKLADFKDLAEIHDRHGKFRNRFLATNLYT